jgi:hypothetical protein
MRIFTVLGLAAIGVLGGCTGEQEFILTTGGSIATTAGDFDNVGAPFDRMVIDHDEYEGLISTATWSTDYNPDNEALKVEGLLGSDNQLVNFGTAFIASGTRGLGLREYNGLDPDDQFLIDPDSAGRVKAFVTRKGHLVATDWAYDLVEQTWPDAIEFFGDDTVYDDAQVGEIQTVSAEITNDGLAEALGMDHLAVNYDFSNWSVIESVDENKVTVLLRGDVTYRVRDGEGTETLTGVPLLVSFQPEGQDKGNVMFSTFHLDAQTPAVIDTLLNTVVAEFDDHSDDPVAPF